MLKTSLLPEKELGTETKTMLKASVNGTAFFVLGYLFVYLFSQLGAAIVASKIFGIKTALHFNGLEFVLGGKSWDSGNVVPVFLTAPAVAFAMAISFLVLLFRLETVGTTWKQFCFWGFLHGLNLSLGAIVCGTLTRDGVWLSFKWALISELVMIGIAIFAFLLLLAIGRFSAVLLFMSCDSLTLMKSENRIALLNGMLLLPFVLGSTYLLLLKFTASNYELLLISVSLLIPLLPLYFNGKKMLVNDRVNAPRRTFAYWELVVLVFVFGVLAKVIL